MNKLTLMDKTITELKKKNRMVCPNCKSKVKVMGFTFTASEKETVPFSAYFRCADCGTEFEIEGETDGKEVVLLSGTKREYGK